MARPKKQTIEYFPHYVNSGKTLFILESEFGNDGYAFWFKLLELLGSTEGHVYDVRNPSELRFLLAKTRVSEETAFKILNLLSELDAIDSELWTNKLIWSQNLVDNVADVYTRRKMEKPSKPSLCSHECIKIDDEESLCKQKPLSAIVSDNKNSQSKVKESKVNEIKVKESKSDNSLPHNINQDDLDNEAIDLCKYYSELLPGQNITQHITTLKIWIVDYGYDWTKEAVKISIKRKSGFIASYIEKILKDWCVNGKEDKNGVNSRDNKSNKDNIYDFSEYGG